MARHWRREARTPAHVDDVRALLRTVPDTLSSTGGEAKMPGDVRSNRGRPLRAQRTGMARFQSRPRPEPVVVAGPMVPRSCFPWNDEAARPPRPGRRIRSCLRRPARPRRPSESKPARGLGRSGLSDQESGVDDRDDDSGEPIGRPTRGIGSADSAIVRPVTRRSAPATWRDRSDCAHYVRTRRISSPPSSVSCSASAAGNRDGWRARDGRDRRFVPAHCRRPTRHSRRRPRSGPWLPAARRRGTAR